MFVKTSLHFLQESVSKFHQDGYNMGLKDSLLSQMQHFDIDEGSKGKDWQGSCGKA